MGAGASGIATAARKDLAGASAADLEAVAKELSEEDRAKFLDALKADATATEAPPASPPKPSGLAKGRAGLLKSFRTGELEKVVDKMEEAPAGGLAADSELRTMAGKMDHIASSHFRCK